jgi:uncharacterized membrane protein
MPREKKRTKKHLLFLIIGSIISAVAGYFYYEYIGKCSSGSCPMTSNPWITVIIAAIMGYLLFDIMGEKIFKKESKEE